MSLSVAASVHASVVVCGICVSVAVSVHVSFCGCVHLWLVCGHELVCPWLCVCGIDSIWSCVVVCSVCVCICSFLCVCTVSQWAVAVAMIVSGRVSMVVSCVSIVMCVHMSTGLSVVGYYVCVAGCACLQLVRKAMFL